VVDAVQTGKAANSLTNTGRKVNQNKRGVRFVGDTDGKIIDTKTTPKGSYTQPDGSRTDVLQETSHFNKKIRPTMALLILTRHLAIQIKTQEKLKQE